MKTIEQQIEETDCDAIRAKFTQTPYQAFDYQCATYRLIAEEIRNKKSLPFVIKAAVSAGKSTMQAMIAARVQQMNDQQERNGREPYPFLLISRQGEIVKQNAEELWDYGVRNSIFCAGLSSKAAAYPVICGSEGTIVGALADKVNPETGKVTHGKLKDYTPYFVAIDECLAGNTLIDTDRGLVRIDSPELIDCKIKCLNEISGDVHYHKPKRVFSNGIKRVSSLKTESGEFIKCTGNHRLLSKGSWLRADSLNIGGTLTLCGRRDSFLTKLRRALAAVKASLCQRVR